MEMGRLAMTWQWDSCMVAGAMGTETATEAAGTETVTETVGAGSTNYIIGPDKGGQKFILLVRKDDTTK